MPVKTKRTARSGGRVDAKTALFFFENSVDLLAVIQDRRFQAVNAAWVEVTGWSMSELTGSLVGDFVHPDDHAAVLEQGRLAREAGVAEGELRLRHADGGWVWVWSRARISHDGRLSAVLRDITADRQREQELKEAQRVRDMLRETAGVGLWWVRPDSGFGWSNELAAMLAGLERVENMFERVHPEDRKRLRIVTQRGLEHGLPDVFDLRFKAPDGSWRHFRNHVRPQPAAPGGYELRAIAQDVTELAVARESAERGAKRLRLALMAANAGVLEIDYVRKTFWGSPEFERIVGRSLSFHDLSSQLWPIIDPTDAASLDAIRTWWELDAQGPLDVQVTLPSGERRWTRMFFDVERGPEREVLRISGLVLDVHEAKQQEIALRTAQILAEEASEAKAEFLANMSHEIRTPMNGVLGVLGLLRAEPLTDDGRKLLDEATACGRMLAELLNDVIDFSRIEAGRLEIHPEPTDVAALVRGVSQLLKPQADEKGLALTVDAPDALWATVDPVRLRQAVFNLAGNAVKFTTSGGVAISLKRNADRLRLEVQDTGPGISDEDQTRLFARFQQLDGSTTRRFGGSGLGLAITRKLAELMGGEVGLKSTLGVGSCFHLEFAGPPAAPAVSAPASTLRVLDGLHVLLVEDNATNRLVIGKMLESLGAEVTLADNGLAGVETAARSRFDLILMDVQMPVMDGLEAVRRIRCSGGPEADCTIIALTANVLAHQAAQYRAAGMDGVVGKPLSPAALLAEIARLAAPEAAEAA